MNATDPAESSDPRIISGLGDENLSESDWEMDMRS